MVHFPFVWWWKIGITGQSAAKRAKWIDETMWGFPIPVFFVVIPGAYGVEQWLHEVCAPLNFRFYNGSGATEWFWFPAAIFAIPVMVTLQAIFIVCICGIGLIFIYAVGNI